MQVYYLSADKKERIDFDGRTYGIADMDIFGHKWSYEERNEKIEKFKRGLLEKEIEINISDDANASWQDHYVYIQDVFDKDIINNKRASCIIQISGIPQKKVEKKIPQCKIRLLTLHG